MELTNAEIKLINALKKSHGRKKHGAFLIEGVKMIEELLQSDLNIILLASTAEWKTNNSAYTQKIYYRELTNNKLQKLSNFTTSNQVLAVATLPITEEFQMQQNDLVLVLDTIQDPGNLGTIIRTADWFGINKILCSKETADAFSPKVVQASMGSIFRLKIYYTNLQKVLSSYQDTYTIYGSLLHGKNIYQVGLKKSGFIVIGNESKGISPEIQELINQAIYIPKGKQSKAESLNAAIACAIILAAFNL